MKKALILVVLIVAPTMAFAQGTVVLNNLTGLVKQWISWGDPRLINVPKNGGYVQLIAAPAGTALLHPLVSYDSFAMDYSSLSGFLAANPGWAAAVNDSGAVPGPIALANGIFNDGVYTIQNIAPGANADYLLIGWIGAYLTADEAIAAVRAAQHFPYDIFGESAIFTTATGNPLLTSAGTAVNLKTTFGGMTLIPFVPEPTTFALAGLGGAAALMIFRRHR